MNLTLAYNACAFTDLTIDGDLSETATMTMANEQLDMSISANGALWFTGAIEGSCNFNFTMTASGNTGGLGGTGSYEFSGTVCGHDVSELNIEASTD
jgi:hypothetical protein